jgi:hypothetical protein
MWDWGVPCRTSLSVASAGFSSAATCVILCRSASSLLVSSSPARKTAPVDDWRARDRSRPRSRSGKGKRRCRGRSAREAGARVRVPPAPPRLPRVVGLPWSGVGRFRSPRGGPAGVRLPAFHPVAVVLAGTFARDAMAPLAHLRRRRRRADELAQAQHRSRWIMAPGKWRGRRSCGGGDRDGRLHIAALANDRAVVRILG